MNPVVRTLQFVCYATVVTLLGLTGCISQELRVSPLAIETARVPLLRGQSTKIRMEDQSTIELSLEQPVAVVDKQGHRFNLQLEEVIAECPTHVPEPGRVCEFRGINYLVVGQRETMRPLGPVLWQGALGVTLLAGLSGLGYCSVNCDAPYNYTSGIALGAIGVAILYAVYDAKTPTPSTGK